MNTPGKNILHGFLRRWQRRLAFETLLYALGAAVLVYLVSQNILLAVGVLIAVAAIASIFIKPWKPNLESASSFLDAKLESLEYSTGLLLAPSEDLSGLARLQEVKVERQLSKAVKTIHPPGNLLRSLITAVVLILLGFLVDRLDLFSSFSSPQPASDNVNAIIFEPIDSTAAASKAPVLTEQWVTIRYPGYTNIPARRTSEMNISAVEGSQLFWELKFDAEVQHTLMQSMGNDYPMTLTDGSFRKNITLQNSGFYNFKFEDLQGGTYSSDLYAIESVKDAAPKVEIKDLKQFISFTYDQEKNVRFNTEISDDFGISNAHIVATVSKGSGESVKFREEKLSFDRGLERGSKKLTLSKTIDLDQINMEPGDELYFYVETSDYKTPAPNVSRSETYFAVIKDTTSYEFSLEGTLGVDRMPDYFRSQRQLIIDTEKLIADRNQLSKKDFNFTSNELGFDQKVLRDKYGAFMGVETEIALAEGDTEAPEENSDNEDDPLAEFTHDHDGDNEHNLVDENDEHDDENEDDKNPLKEFMHDHGDPEMATLFEESLKSKLRKALGEMWDAELHLRLYKPENSLPYQYRALRLIQDIKNSARIYVHRIGFDPPPIKEESRLTGELDEVSSFRKSANTEEEDPYPAMRETIVRLGEIVSKEASITPNDTALFKQAGNELSALAIQSPGSHLVTLQQLKKVVEGTETSPEALNEVRKGLFYALPDSGSNPVKSALFLDEINKLLLKELDLHD